MCASKPRTSPFTFAFDGGRNATRIAAPTTMTSLSTSGGKDRPMSRSCGVRRTPQVGLQIDETFVTEGGVGPAGLRVQRDERLAWRHR